MSTPITRAYFVTGRVQGVGFRFHTQRQAIALGLHGAAVNLSDGRVYVEAIGLQDDVWKLREWLQQGPRFARVDSVTEVTISQENSARMCGLTDFSTR